MRSSNKRWQVRRPLVFSVQLTLAKNPLCNYRVNFHPHIHAIVRDGEFTPHDSFLCLPGIDKELLLTVWQNKVFELFVAAGKIDQETTDPMRSWPHSGFSVDDSVYVPPGDKAGLPRLAEYILRCAFSLARVVRLTDVFQGV